MNGTKLRILLPSSVITRFNYDTDKLVLRIVFASGMVYDYLNVPQHINQAMKNAFSKGIYFNQHIKNYYSFKKISE